MPGLNDWKRTKIENLAMLFEGAIIAREKIGLKMNVSKGALNQVLEKLPALRNPRFPPYPRTRATRLKR